MLYLNETEAADPKTQGSVPTHLLCPLALIQACVWGILETGLQVRPPRHQALPRCEELSFPLTTGSVSTLGILNLTSGSVESAVLYENDQVFKLKHHLRA